MGHHADFGKRRRNQSLTGSWSTRLDLAVRRRWMSGIDQSQSRTTDTKLNLIAVKQCHGFRDPLIVDESSIETSQIANRELIAASLNLGMTTRDHRGISVDDHLTFGVATEARYFFIQFDPPGLSRA
jgi:hypothetical protein